MANVDPMLSRDRIRQRLGERAATLRQAIAGNRPGPQDDGHEVSDRKDEAFVGTTRAIGDAQVERELAELRDIEGALARLDEGTYGICSDCGAEIAPGRLEAQPAALRCAACQQVVERHAPPAR